MSYTKVARVITLTIIFFVESQIALGHGIRIRMYDSDTPDEYNDEHDECGTNRVGN